MKSWGALIPLITDYYIASGAESTIDQEVRVIAST
jgi:hypothetical protein